MRAAVSFFRALVCPVLIVWCSCTNPARDESCVRVRFAVLDVGQGLSQAAVVGDSAVVWDMGDIDMFRAWQEGYRALGTPRIKAVAISHSDMDHVGGLYRLPPDADFGGLVVVSCYEDTALLRDSVHEWWSQTLRFRVVYPGDTLACLDGVRIECIWPPDSAHADAPWLEHADKNSRSLCFRVSSGNTSALLTGDIDSAAARLLGTQYGFALKSDIVVVPHHGSRGSLDAAFYGYVLPDAAVISCGAANSYGHPHEEVVRFLTMQMGVAVYDTRIVGTAAAVSNGEYWTWR